MIKKLIANRFLNLQVFPESHSGADPAWPAHFVRGDGHIFNIKESQSSGLFSRVKTSQISVGEHPVKGHRTFHWLPWIPGKVSCVPLDGTDILTGKMTGCWLVIFRRNGVHYAAHIGTHENAASANTIQVKAAWRNAVNAELIQPVAAFNPTGPSLPALGTLNLKNEVPEFYGGYTAAGVMYTVVLTCCSPNSSTLRRIAKVVQMPVTTDVTAF